MLYGVKGIALLELVLSTSIIVVVVLALSGLLQRVDLFQEVDTRLSDSLTSYQVVERRESEVLALQKTVKTLGEVLEESGFEQYGIALNLVNYNGAILDNFDVRHGNLANLDGEYSNSIEAILSKEISSQSLFKEQAYQISSYQQNRYLSNLSQNLLETKFIVIRLIIKQEKGFVSFLDQIGFNSNLYFEKIMRISR